MKFRNFKEFSGNAIEAVTKYLSVELVSTLRELSTGLTALTFGDNFKSFEVTVTIAAGTEARIRNALSEVPTKRLIVRHSGDPSVVDGATWDINFVTLKNTGAAPATVTAIFMR